MNEQNKVHRLIGVKATLLTKGNVLAFERLYFLYRSPICFCEVTLHPVEYLGLFYSSSLLSLLGLFIMYYASHLYPGPNTTRTARYWNNLKLRSYVISTNIASYQ